VLVVVGGTITVLYTGGDIIGLNGSEGNINECCSKIASNLSAMRLPGTTPFSIDWRRTATLLRHPLGDRLECSVL
jgi:hypothetical protein